MSEPQPKRPPAREEPDEGVDPPRLALLLMVLFPFLLMLVAAALYVWLTG